MSNKLERPEKRHTWLGHFWTLNFPLVTYLYFFQQGTWAKISILYLVFVSLYANASTEYGNSKSSRAARLAEDSTPKKILRAFTR
jgi:hypothetical protein